MLKKIEKFEEWLDYFRNRIDGVYIQIKQLDEKEMFSKDDDVGIVFSELVKIIKEFDDEIK